MICWFSFLIWRKTAPFSFAELVFWQVCFLTDGEDLTNQVSSAVRFNCVWTAVMGTLHTVYAHFYSQKSQMKMWDASWMWSGDRYTWFRGVANPHARVCYQLGALGKKLNKLAGCPILHIILQPKNVPNCTKQLKPGKGLDNRQGNQKSPAEGPENDKDD